MRKRFIAVALVLTSCIGAESALAQFKSQPGATQFGVVGGANFATFTGSDASGATTRTGFYGGLSLTMGLGGSLFFQPQALYSMKGATASDSGVTGEYKLDYIEVPLLLGLRVPLRGSNIRPYLVAGPTLAYLASCKVKASFGGISVEAKCSGSGSGTSNFDASLAVGGGVELPMGRGLLALSARFAMGITKPFEGTNMRNSVISVGAGYYFPTSR